MRLLVLSVTALTVLCSGSEEQIIVQLQVGLAHPMYSVVAVVSSVLIVSSFTVLSDGSGKCNLGNLVWAQLTPSRGDFGHRGWVL